MEKVQGNRKREIKTGKDINSIKTLF